MKNTLKKLLYFVCVIVGILAFSLSANAATEGYYTYDFYGTGEAYITAVDPEISGEVIVPSTLGGQKVVYINNSAFENCDLITSVVIPDTITSIGPYAFQDCNSLVSVKLPKYMEGIHDGAFANCTSLKEIVIPEGLFLIGGYAFSGCISLESVSIPEGLFWIGRYVFSGCISLESVSIPNDLPEIPAFTFSGCESLTSISIPSSVTYIGSYAFSGCSALSSIDILGNDVFIDSTAFNDTGYYNNRINWVKEAVPEDDWAADTYDFRLVLYINGVEIASEYINKYDTACNHSWAVWVLDTTVAPNVERRTCSDCGFEEAQVLADNTDEAGKWLSPIEFDYAQDFKNGFAFAVRGNTAGYVDENGSFIECYEITDEVLWAMRRDDYAHDEFTLEVSPEGLYTYYDIDTGLWGVRELGTGKTVIPANSCGATICRSERIVVVEDFGNEYGTTVYDTDGEVVFSFEGGAWNYYLDCGLLVTMDGLYDKHGNFIDINIVEGLGYMAPELYVRNMGWSFAEIREGGSLRVFDVYDECVAYYSAEYPFAELLYEDVVSEYGYISQNGYMCYKDPDNGLVGLMRLDGKENKKTILAEYTSMSYVYNGKVWAVSQDGKYGVLNAEDGSIILDFEYEQLYAPEKEYIAAKKDGKFGVVDYNSNVLIDFVYDNIIPRDLFLYYELGEECGLMDKNGNILCTFSAEQPMWLEDIVRVGSLRTIEVDFQLTPVKIPASYRFYSIKDVVDSCEHKYGEWVIAKQPTITERGEETRTCEKCGATEKRSISSISDELLSYDFAVSAEKVRGTAGSTVSVDIDIEKNSKGLGGMELKIGFDSTKLTLISVDKGKAFSSMVVGPIENANQTGEIIFTYSATANYNGNDNIATLTFAVNEGVEECTSPITVSTENSDAFYYDGYEMVDLELVGISGEVNVIDVIPGDTNGDGAVTVRDAALILQYKAGWNVRIDLAAADTNGDGEVSVRDAALILQYKAGWNVTLG